MSTCREIVDTVAGDGRLDKPVLKAGANFGKCKLKTVPVTVLLFVAEIFTGIPGNILNLKTICYDFDEVGSGNCVDTLETVFLHSG